MENIEFLNNGENHNGGSESHNNDFQEEMQNDGLMFEKKAIPNIIKVLGVGGGGSNAVNYMFKQGIEGVDFVVCNTDAQSLQASPVPVKVKLGNRKLGAGSKPEVGRQSAIESVEEIKKSLEGDTKMLFITAGMGGGTGTGAAPVIAEVAKKLGILTVGIVSIPFEWEGAKRVKIAENGIDELKKHVDTLIVISNSKLRELYGNLSLREAFSKADDILKTAAKGIAEIITVPGYVNVDFEDVKTVMTENESGKAIMSSAQAEGENRAIEAVEEALTSPLLDDNDIYGASDILLHIITGTKDLTMDEIEEITEHIQSKAAVDGVNANLIWGNASDDSLGEALSVTIIATGFNNKKRHHDLKMAQKPEKTVHVLGENMTDDKQDESSPIDALFNKEEQQGLDEPVLIKKEPETKDSVIEEVSPEPQKENKDELDFETDGTGHKKKVVFDLFGSDTVENEVKNDNAASSGVDQIKKVEKKERPNISEGEAKDTVAEVAPDPEKVKHADERRKKLKRLSSNLSDFEKTPAYVRKNIELDDSAPSENNNVSTYSLGVDNNNNTVLNKGNSFLNKDVD